MVLKIVLGLQLEKMEDTFTNVLMGSGFLQIFQVQRLHYKTEKVVGEAAKHWSLEKKNIKFDVLWGVRKNNVSKI